MATVIIPTPLRKFTNQTARLQVAAGTVGEIIEKITLDYPELKKHPCLLFRCAYVQLRPIALGPAPIGYHYPCY